MTGLRRAGLAAVGLIALAAAPAPTQQQVQDADRARAAMQEATRAAGAKAAAASAEAQLLAEQRVDAAARLRALEEATQEAADRVAAWAERQRQAQARLDARSADIGPLLPLIERLSLYPAETLLAVPMAPDDAVRGVLVLAGMSRQLEADAGALRGEQAAASRAQAALEAELPSLAAAQALQARAAVALDAQIAAALQLRKSATDAELQAARGAAEEAAKATSLRAAIARIEELRQAEQARAKAQADQAERQKRQPDTTTPRPAATVSAGPGLGAPRGALTAPVSGSVVRGFGEATEAGPATGVSYQAPPAARVVSPCGGRVVFAGPFRSFGRLLIVDCGGGYHFVLSGFERLDAQVGASIRAGEPVGIMPSWDPRADPHGGAGRPSLYVELRRDGQPVNPAPFLRARS